MIPTSSVNIAERVLSDTVSVGTSEKAYSNIAVSRAVEMNPTAKVSANMRLLCNEVVGILLVEMRQIVEGKQ